MSEESGLIYRISGPVVTAVGISPRMYEVVRVGDEGLMGEVIELHGDQSVIQVYEETSGIRPGEPVVRTGQTLSVKLGPGLLTQIYDGIQRPLEDLEETMGVFITRGGAADGHDTGPRIRLVAGSRRQHRDTRGVDAWLVILTRILLHEGEGERD